MKDKVFSADPGFVLRRSPVLTTIFAVLVALALVALVLSIAYYPELLQNRVLSRRGRSVITELGGIIAPGAVLISAFVTFVFTWLLISGSSSWVRLSTGSPLRTIQLRAAGDDTVAAELHRRLASGDPAQYLPLPIAKRGEIHIGAHWSEKDRRAFFTVSRGEQTWPLIELRDRAYVQVKRRDIAGYGRSA